MKAAQILKSKLASDNLTTGVIVTFHLWPGLVEILIRSGIDYAIIDFEHLTHDAETVAECCAIGRRADFPILIRPPQAEFTPIRLAMDLGPCGLLVPYVSSLEDMALISSAVLMAPRGRRRPGGHGNFWVDSYHYETFRREVEDDLIILPQIENREGLACVDEIAAHPLTTALAIGPYDLSASLGCCWKPEAVELREAMGRIREAGLRHGKSTWVIGDPDALTSQGFRFIGISEPSLLIESALRSANLRIKSGQAAPASDVLLP
jgi:4-hydroxy-2-oxoheptanedioate aldolase